jgi:hypothetical protein
MRFLLYAVPLVVVLYAFIDVAFTPGALMRTLPKAVWFLVVVLIPLVGALAWFFLGRPSAVPASGGGGLTAAVRRRGPVAPDDDPRFLRSLEDDAWARRMRERREGGPTEPPTDPAEH